MTDIAKESDMAMKAPKRDVTETASTRKYLSQADVPGYSLSQAERVSRAIAENYGKAPTKPLRVAQAMNMSPGSSYFRMLCGASIAYGLTEGGYNTEQIALTPLGRRVVAPTKDGDDHAARREALLRPRVIREFLTRYNGSRLPTDQIARNVLEEMGVPPNKTEEVLELMLEGAKELGFLREVKGQHYVDMETSESPTAHNILVKSSLQSEEGGSDEAADDSLSSPLLPKVPEHTQNAKRTNRVFITHGRNKEIVGQLKELLTFGSFTPVVSIEQETVSKPVPDKVLDDMRSCDAAIIHVGTDVRVMDSEGKEHKMLNQNVLIEIGAAMALYDRKFILLVEKGATLPSNLQGLYEVRYEGDKLDYEATMRLLKAFNDFRG